MTRSVRTLMLTHNYVHVQSHLVWETLAHHAVMEGGMFRLKFTLCAILTITTCVQATWLSGVNKIFGGVNMCAEIFFFFFFFFAWGGGGGGGGGGGLSSPS